MKSDFYTDPPEEQNNKMNTSIQDVGGEKLEKHDDEEADA